MPMTRNLLVRFHSLGDVVLASGIASKMSEAGELTFVSKPIYKSIIERIPGDIRFSPYSGSWKDLRKEAANFDKIIDLQNNIATKLAFAGKDVRRFSFSRRARRKVLFGSTEKLPWRAEEYLKVWSDTGNATPTLKRLNQPTVNKFTVGIVAGGRWLMKSILPGTIAELARLFCDIKGADVQILGEKSDRELADSIVESCGFRSVEQFAGEGSVEDLINRIEKLDLLISPDSGPAHLAMALGVPTQVVFTSTSPSLGFWQPDYKGNFMVKSVPCRPCHKHGGNKCSLNEQCRKLLIPREMYEDALCLLG